MKYQAPLETHIVEYYYIDCKNNTNGSHEPLQRNTLRTLQPTLSINVPKQILALRTMKWIIQI